MLNVLPLIKCIFISNSFSTQSETSTRVFLYRIQVQFGWRLLDKHSILLCLTSIKHRRGEQTCVSPQNSKRLAGWFAYCTTQCTTQKWGAEAVKSSWRIHYLSHMTGSLWTESEPTKLTNVEMQHDVIDRDLIRDEGTVKKHQHE